MQNWIWARAAYLVVGAAAAVAATWLLPFWPVQPSLSFTGELMNAAERAQCIGFYRAEIGLCFALNATWCTAAVWLAAEVAALFRARAPVRPSSSPRT